MPEYRYEALDASQQPIHGMLSASSVDELRTLLNQRGQQLVSAVGVQLPKQQDSDRGSIRLSQLRISESVRTAFTTQLPVDVVLNASAREPVWNPASAILPWIQVGTSILLVLSIIHSGASGGIGTPFLVCLALTVLAFGPVWYLVRRMERQPRKALKSMSEQLQAGQSDLRSMSRLLPGNLGAVAESDLTEEQKLLAVSELLSTTSSSAFARHRLFLNLLGPVCLLIVTLGVFYAFLALVVPGFREIFDGFALDLPVITTLIVSVSSAVAKLGVAGAVALLLFACIAVFALFMVIYRGWLNPTLQAVPLLGAGLSWINLAGVSRWLAAMLRSNASADESLRVAVCQTHNNDMRQDGTHIASIIERGGAPEKRLTSLTGLPLALLSGLAQSPDDTRRRTALASTLDSLSAMFERAVFSSGSIIAGFLHAVILVVVSTVVGLAVFALFLPLVQLLNDLS